MSDETDTIRSVAWGEVFPWLMIPRAVRLAISVPMLFVATVGFLLMPLGWWGASLVLPERDRTAATLAERSLRFPATGQANGLPAESGISLSLEAGDFYGPMLSAAGSLVAPLRHMLRFDVSWSELAYWSLGGIWNLLVWGLLGGVITRIAVMRYGRDEREGLGSALRFVGRRFLAFVGAPLFALLGVLVVLALSLCVGGMMQWDVGVLAVSAIWIFVLLGGLLTTLLIFGLLLGWPLMWGALSAEQMGDVFEGTQRTFAYLYGRPLNYAFYALVTVVVGSLTYQVAALLAQSVVHCSFWAISWGMGSDILSVDAADGPLAAVGASIITGLNSLVFAVAAAFRYSFLFTAAGAVYLLVRRDSDQIEFDNVHVAGEQTRFGLPPLTTDEAGVSGVPENDSE